MVPALLLLASCLLAAAPSCEAHGFLLTPLSRVLALGVGYGEWQAAEGNGFIGRAGGLPDVCGDPHQSSGPLNIKNRPTAIQGQFM